jgi:hypothetical protein
MRGAGGGLKHHVRSVGGRYLSTPYYLRNLPPTVILTITTTIQPRPGRPERSPDRQVNSDVQGSRKRIKEALGQLHGLARALEAMHDSAGNIRSPSLSALSFDGLPSPENLNREAETKKDAAIAPISPNGRTVPIINLPETLEGGQAGFPDTQVSAPPPSPGKLSEPEQGIVRRSTIGDSLETQHWCHGDIKLENILRFKGRG